MNYMKMKSPLGELTLITSDQGLCAILWPNDNPKRVVMKPTTEMNDHPILMQTKKQLSEYFAGERQEFSIPLDFMGTDFQKQVWLALQTVGYGQTTSYLDLALKLGKPTGARAVGMANGRNPISIIVPCHRVIGASGLLTGYAGGLENKKKLLLLEGATFKDS